MALWLPPAAAWANDDDDDDDDDDRRLPSQSGRGRPTATDDRRLTTTDDGRRRPRTTDDITANSSKWGWVWVGSSQCTPGPLGRPGAAGGVPAANRLAHGALGARSGRCGGLKGRRGRGEFLGPR
eukprot:5457162-Pyramimonas_sp.AAC.1